MRVVIKTAKNDADAKLERRTEKNLFIDSSFSWLTVECALSTLVERLNRSRLWSKLRFSALGILLSLHFLALPLARRESHP
jgi:hypothetical protein